VWNEWNNLDIAAVIFAIVMIGIVGMLLDAVLAQAGHFLRYQE
jgi:nitrate/nitrite transport system permease protein